MNIKSLLIGSAAAFAAVSGAQAADAIVAAEPEPMEYVRVCDAFGTGFFYIPGTETCLKIGGFVRFQTGIARDELGTYQAGGGESSDWDAFTLIDINFDARNDTELGTLRSFVNLEYLADNDVDGDSGFDIDEAYIELGGFKVGFFYSWWDSGINGETDTHGNVTEFNSIAYNFDGGTWRAGISVDELEDTNYGTGDTTGNAIGVAGTVGFSLGGVNLDLLGGYDSEAEEGAVRGIVSADLGPGTLQVLGVWASDPNAYWDASEWTVAASYAFKATEKLTITPAAQYFGDVDFDSDVDQWRVGLTIGYQIVSGLDFLGTVDYNKVNVSGGADTDYTRTDVLAGGHDDATSGFLRLQRNF